MVCKAVKPGFDSFLRYCVCEQDAAAEIEHKLPEGIDYLVNMAGAHIS